MRDSLGCVPILTCPVINVNRLLQQLNIVRTIKGTDPSGMKVWFTLSKKHLRPAEMVVE